MAVTLATKDQFKEYLGIKGTEDDPLITRLLAATEGLVYKYLARPVGSLLAPFSFTWTGDGNSKDVIVLPYWPIQTITSVVISYPMRTPTNVAIDQGYVAWGSEDTLDSRMVYLTGGIRFPFGKRNVVITGTSGYTAVPDAIVQGQLEMVGKAYNERKRLGETSKSVGGETVSGYSSLAMLNSTKLLLDAYKNRVPG
jgi:hypothetical protein